jgi:hypothetical protein
MKRFSAASRPEINAGFSLSKWVTLSSFLCEMVSQYISSQFFTISRTFRETSPDKMK